MNTTISAFKRLFLVSILLLSCQLAKATHFYGADLFYTHVSGLTYKVTLVVYGDCAGASFPSFATASPRIRVSNGSSFYSNLTLIGQAPTSGTEVTPVCSSQINNTACNGGSIPGVKQFVYSRNITLNTTSTNWIFRFTGAMGTSSAGRSNSISNIAGGGSSIMNLEATLNNTVGANSSPTYTTIPTPFFCINKAANYNPGTVDINGDVLTYSLVPGLTQTGTVSYLTGYSATNPLSATTGTFSFSGTTGQLSFTPNIVQRSLVVTKVNEFRNGTLVGTSMREMTFVVLSNCNNNPPGGGISNNNTGTVSSDSLSIQACQSSGVVNFKINPTDLDNDTINVTTSGLPAGASFTVTNNNTASPSGNFSWNLTNVTPGSYNFFITFTDNGCPLSSKQTLAYTITVLPKPKMTFALNSAATCTKKAVFTMTPSVTPSPWKIEIFQGVSNVHTFTGVTGAQVDSLDPGTYTFRVTNADTCFRDTIITIAPPPAILPTFNYTLPTCFGGNDGKIEIIGTGGKAPFQYKFGTGSYSSTNTFTGLAAGTYTVSIKDANDCIKDTTIIFPNPPRLDANITFQKPPCNYFNSGVITVNAFNGTPPYEYALGTGSFSSTNTFSGLFSGNYTIHIKDSNNCTRDTVVTLPDSIKVHALTALTHIKCHGDSTGIIIVNAFGGTAPYKYQYNGGALTPTNIFINMPAGTYNFHIEDTNKCYLDTAIVLNQPDSLVMPVTITQPLCNGDTNGVVVVNGGGGIPPYEYAIGTGSFSTTNTFNNLGAGTYTIRIKDSNDCVKDTSITVNQPAVLAIASLPVTNPYCFGVSDGTITFNATGGTTPYSYKIGTGTYGASNAFTGLGPNTYTVYVRDNNNCEKDTTVTLVQPPAIIPTVDVLESTCTPLDNGKITLSATGGTPGYTYAIGTNPFTASPTFTALATGTYIVRVKDANDCIKDTTVFVDDSIKVAVAITAVNAKCFDSASGSITAVASAGTSPYKYAIDANPFGSTNSFTNLKAGTYAIHVRDDIGCEKDTNVTLTEPNRLRANLNIVRPSCNGYSDGQVNVFPIGGTPTYKFRWGGNPYIHTNPLNGLSAGFANVRVTDTNNCIFDTVINITEPAILDYTLNVTNVLCKGEFSGQVEVNATGGTAPYIYASNFNAFQSSNTLTSLGVGNNLIRLRDVNDCFKDSTITLTEPDSLLIDNVTVTHPTCEGFTDGAVTLVGKGGTIPYTYNMNTDPFVSSNTFGDLLEGAYTFTIKDGNGCEADTPITLKGYPHININGVTIDDVTCFGYSNGSIAIDADGGVQPLKYQIGNSNLVDINQFNKLVANTYTITVVDDANCKKDTTVTVNSPDLLQVKLSSVPNDCEGYDDDAYITTEVQGGTTPYYYKWSTNPPKNGPELRGIPNGVYTVIVSDRQDCADTASATIVYNNCCKPFIPDAFTPNGDGRNDKLKILMKGDFELLEFSIYNRFGQRVFTSSSMNQAWDGRFNGEMQDLGTFNYYIKGICGNKGNNTVEYKGTLTLLH